MVTYHVQAENFDEIEYFMVVDVGIRARYINGSRNNGSYSVDVVVDLTPREFSQVLQKCRREELWQTFQPQEEQ